MGLLDLLRKMSGKEDGSSAKRSFSSRIPSFSKRRQQQQQQQPQAGAEEPLLGDTSRTGDTPKHHSSRGAPYKRNFGFGFRKRQQNQKEQTNPSEMVQQLEATIAKSGGAMTKDSLENRSLDIDKQQNVPSSTQISKQDVVEKTPNSNRTRWGVKKSQTVVTDRNSNFALPATPEVSRSIRNMPKSKSEESIKSTSSQERAKSGRSRLPKSHTMNPTRPLQSQSASGSGSARVVKPVVRPQNLVRAGAAPSTADTPGSRVRTQSNASTASNVSSASHCSTRTPKRSSQETAQKESGQKVEGRSSAASKSAGKTVGGHSARGGTEADLKTTPAKHEAKKDTREKGTPVRSHYRQESSAKSPKSPGVVSSSRLKPESPLTATVRRDSFDLHNESASSDLESDDLMLDMDSSHDEHEQSFDQCDERPRHHRRWHSPRRNARAQTDGDGREDSDTLEELDTSHSQKSPRTQPQRVKKQGCSEQNHVAQDRNATPETQRRRNRRRYRRRQYGRSRAQTTPSDSPHRDRPRSQSTPMKPPRQMSASFDEEEGVTIDTSSFRYLLQDMTGMKTCLLKLKRILQEVETSSPFEHTPAGKGFTDKNHLLSTMLDGAMGEVEGKGMKKENEDMRKELAQLRQQLAEKDRTISLLQTQMEKYSDARDGHVTKSVKSVATQTEPQSKRFPWSRPTPLSRSQSMREPSPITPGRKRRYRRQKNNQKLESDAQGTQPSQTVLSTQRRSERRSAQKAQDYLDPIEELYDQNLPVSDGEEEERGGIHHSSSSQQHLSDTEQTLDILSVYHNDVSTHNIKSTAVAKVDDIDIDKLKPEAYKEKHDFASLTTEDYNQISESIAPQLPYDKNDSCIEVEDVTVVGNQLPSGSTEGDGLVATMSLLGAEVTSADPLTTHDEKMQITKKEVVMYKNQEQETCKTIESSKDSSPVPVLGAEGRDSAATEDHEAKCLLSPTTDSEEIKREEQQKQQQNHEYMNCTDISTDQSPSITSPDVAATTVDTLASSDHELSSVQDSHSLNTTFSIEKDDLSACLTESDVVNITLEVEEEKGNAQEMTYEITQSDLTKDGKNEGKKPLAAAFSSMQPLPQEQRQEDGESSQQRSSGADQGLETIRERSLSFAGFGRPASGYQHGNSSYADVLTAGSPAQGGAQPLRERSQSFAALKGTQGRRGIPMYQKSKERSTTEGVIGRSQSYTGLQEQGRSGIPSMKKNTPGDVNTEGALAKGKSQSLAALKYQGKKESRMPLPSQGRGGQRFAGQPRESSIPEMRGRSFTFPKSKATKENTEKQSRKEGKHPSAQASETVMDKAGKAAPSTPSGGTAAGTEENAPTPKGRSKGRIPVFGKWYKR
ncbi:serine/arginine repetitive matrix protein 2-like isoform X2 [Branchiostoma floridae]|uniref:Serine/arginine repetitive matrix protein 2-like isoform X2 n=1 Tax=Branchiostoma floridae TaxID=7739 RepID=A0A9J7KS50_BRAFL|nr:serine/arginine repetitive matrix protein 2-like isoform X2 [Branchiostoma floridae]